MGYCARHLIFPDTLVKITNTKISLVIIDCFLLIGQFNAGIPGQQIAFFPILSPSYFKTPLFTLALSPLLLPSGNGKRI